MRPECQCDPPGSGEEFCTGHCVLRAEIKWLQATLRVARELRTCQRRYFKERTTSALTESKRLEKELDRLLAGQN